MNKKSAGLLRGTAFLTGVFMICTTASVSWANGWGNHHDRDETCFKTTSVMKEACNADIIDDFFEEVAKCLNTDDVRDCKREAKAEYREARGDCSYQADGRNDLCERLPDAGPYIVDLDPANFNGGCPDGNKFYPLIVGTVTTFVSEEDEGETIIVEVTDETREIDGIEAIVVRDTVYEGLPDEEGNPDGDRIEDTDDYYAVANNCDVWYLGEVSQSFEDGYLESLDGSFAAGINGAQAGIIMLGNPMQGDVYRQEFALGDAEDAAEVLSLGTDIFDENGDVEEFDNPDFNCNGACLETEDFIANDPDGTEFKYFKAGIGFVAEQLPGGEVVLKLIKEEKP